MHSTKKWAALAAVIALSLSACSSDDPAEDPSGSTTPGNDAPLIAFAQESVENSWRSENTDSIVKTLEGAGYRVIYQQADADQARQIAQVQTMLQQNPALLVVEPAEQEAATPIVGLAEEAGVPLLVADQGLGATPGVGQYKTLITVNWEEMGKAFGELAVQILTDINGSPKGTIVEIVGNLGSAPQIGLDKGFQSVISQYPEIKILDSQDGDNQRGPGMTIMENYLSRFAAGQIDMVWAQNDEMALGALRAIQNAGRDELLGRIIGKDGLVEAMKEVAAGNLAATCSNTPYFGPIILPYVQQILAGETVAATPDKPFTCFNNLTPEADTEAKDVYQEMLDGEMMFAPR
ncbi:MAG: substrate-binding domain-containing protein [Propionibacteriaceae bacterium]|nr:substrate-binding domain-containing protein [Propionibacteriaceae bacterium]